LRGLCETTEPIYCVFATDNKPIPTALRKEAISIHKTLDWDDEGGDGKCLVDTRRKNLSSKYRGPM